MPPPPRPPRLPAALPSGLVGLLAILAVALPLQIVRIQLEGSWWVDESESVLLASGPVGRLLDYCASDTNPPGYFLALKVWLALGRQLLGTPGVLWIRAPGLLVWALLLSFLWARGRELFGAVAGSALAVAVISSTAVNFFVEARGFGIASAAALAGALLLWGLIRDAGLAAPPAGRWRAWLAYGLCAEAALWCHLLSTILLALGGALWAAAAWRRRARAPWLLREGAFAHAAIVLAFSPWIGYLGNQMATRRNEDPWWLTPATFRQWRLVFTRWYPLGEADLPAWAGVPLGVLTFALPVGAAIAVALVAIAARGRRRAATDRPVSSGLLAPAVGFLATAILFTSILWGMQRWLGLTVFHGPRYPALAAGFWAGGLALLSAWAVGRAGGRPALVWLLLAPWLVAGWTGQLLETADDGVAVFARKKEVRHMPPPGATLFLLPASLAPTVERSLAAWRLRPAADLPCALAAAPAGGDAWLLDLSFLNMLDTPGDTLMTSAAGERVLSRDVTVHHLLPPQHYTLYHLRGVFPERARAICAQGGLRPAPRPIPASAASVALPEAQRLQDGWFWFDADAGLGYRRWWIRPRVPLRFDRPMPPGDYVLHYRGTCLRHREEPQDLHLRLAGSSLNVQVRHEEGEIAADLPFHWNGAGGAPVLWLEHPMIPPRRLGLSDVPVLQMGSLLRYAWIESRPAR